ncbi:MAG TPA: CAP domain-containing protein [Prolixibacteraceae bacterium]|nr:CAP domain-containing protein [Prolixibacteraceae bacterium]
MKNKILALLFILLGHNLLAQANFEWPIKELDTARDVNYLSIAEKDIILEMNMLRYNPAQYANQFLTWMGVFYDNKMLSIPGKTPILTSEGREAYLECLKVLSEAESVSILKPSRGMSRSCQLLVLDQSLTDKTGHKGSSNTTPVDRLNQFGSFLGYFAENIHYGDIEPRFVIISLLIDDGVKSRGHRKTLLDNNFNYTGLALGSHKTYGGMCVITYTSKYNEN